MQLHCYIREDDSFHFHQLPLFAILGIKCVLKNPMKGHTIIIATISYDFSQRADDQKAKQIKFVTINAEEALKTQNYYNK